MTRDSVKAYAHLAYPEAWESYSGKEKAVKQRYDRLRRFALDSAAVTFGYTSYLAVPENEPEPEREP